MPPLSISATPASAQAFFAKPYFAVVGASTNQAKFGYKSNRLPLSPVRVSFLLLTWWPVFAWYTRHGLPVTPINLTAPSIAVDGTDHATLSNISALPHPRDTALSVVTAPDKTLQILKDAQKLGISSVWLQPETWDDAVVEFATAKGNFADVVAGGGGHGHGGWCVLVDGDWVLNENKKENGKL